MTTEDNLISSADISRFTYKAMVKLALYHLKKATKKETALEAKLPIATVSTIFNELLEKHEIMEHGVKESSSGKKAKIYALNYECVNILSVIAAPAKIEYTLTDLFGQVVDKRAITIKSEISYLDNIKEIIQEVVRYNKKIVTIAIGVPGVVTDQGTIYEIPQIIQLEETNLKRELEEQFHIPAIVTNDINTTAFGFYRKGISFTLKEMVYIHIGGGLGGAVIINGSIVKGFTNFAGEVAFMHVGERKKVEDLILNPRWKKKKELYLSKLLINIIALINPSLVVLGGVADNDGMADRILNECRKWISEIMLPRIRVVEDERRFYFDGLAEIAAEKYLEGNYEINRKTHQSNCYLD